ncbi:MAG: cell wall-binding repeat-containing protein [Coriobacteriia bacterium]|nr:cell wall-binding repeat-containing protein [Coriobacteriia bacterium]
MARSATENAAVVKPRLVVGSGSSRRVPRRASLLAAFALALTLAVPSTAGAMLREMGVAELSAEAASVVVADVTSIRTERDASGEPVTLIELDVLHTIAGAQHDRLELKIAGGRIGDELLHVTGMPSFAEGERVVVFADDGGRVVGGTQGRFGMHGGRVIESQESLVRFAERVLAGRYGNNARLYRPARADSEILALSASDGTAEETSGGIEGLSVPTISAISPAAVPAGAGATVKLSGSGFGSSTGTVYFSHGASLVTGRVISWSDTLVEVEVPADVSSGSVRVANSGGAMSPTPTPNLTITYSLSTFAWPTTTLPFKIDSSVSSSRQNLIRNGALAWNGIANVGLSYTGTVSSASVRSGNGTNEVWWGDTGSDTALAIAKMWFTSDRNGDGFSDLTEADVIFSSSETAWGDGGANTYDIQSVASHEFGHWLSLRDLYGAADAQANKVMYGRIMRGTQRRTLAADDRAGLRAVFGGAAQPSAEIELNRIYGPGRYETAVAISARTFAGGTVPTAVLATGRQFADALSASGLAGAYRSPLLLTSGLSLESCVLNELARLGATRVVIVGGTSAVSAAVESTLRTRGYTVERVQGADRYATAAAVARKTAQVAGPSFRGEAFIARGDAFADALAASPLAYSRVAPVLLVRPGDIPQTTASAMRDIGISSAVIVGGTGAVSSQVEKAIVSSGVTVTRRSGNNRYATARSVVQYAIARSWTSAELIGVSTGENFPDALGGGAAAGAKGGAIMLTRSTLLSPETRSTLLDCTADLSRIEVYGGPTAVCDTVYDSIRSIWNLAP